MLQKKSYVELRTNIVIGEEVVVSCSAMVNFMPQVSTSVQIITMNEDLYRDNFEEIQVKIQEFQEYYKKVEQFVINELGE